MIHFGAFDSANLGDRLYPLLWRHLSGTCPVVAGLRSHRLPEYDTEHIDDLAGEVIVGGGDLFATTREYQGFMKLPAWPRSCREGFILDRRSTYVSVGCPFPNPTPIDGFIWARDYRSALNMSRWPDIVAPDMAVLTSEVFAAAPKPDKPMAVVQFAYPNPGALPFLQALRESYEIRLLSFTHYNGDAEAMRPVAEKLGVDVRVIESAPAMASEISEASLVIASSMHANILAFSYGIPHWFTPTPPMNKIPGFLEVVGLPSYLAAKSWADIRLERSITELELLERAKRRVRNAIDLALNAG